MIHRAMGFVLLAAPLLGGVAGCAASRSHTVRSNTHRPGSAIDGADQRLLSIAKGYERRGNFSKARKLYDTVLTRHPHQSAALRGLQVVAAREKTRRELDRSLIAKRKSPSNHDTQTVSARVRDSQSPIPQKPSGDRPVVAPHPTGTAVVTADSNSADPVHQSSATVEAASKRSPFPAVAAAKPRRTKQNLLSPSNQNPTHRPHAVALPSAATPVVSTITIPKKVKRAQAAPFPKTAGQFVLPDTRPLPQPASEFDIFPGPSGDGQKTVRVEQHSNTPHTTVIEAYADNPDRAVPRLAKLLDDDNAGNRSLAAYLLGQAGRAAKSTLPILHRRLKDEPNDLIRIYLAEALVRVDPDDQEGIHVLLRGLDDRVESIRLLSACALSGAADHKHQTEAVRALTASLYDTAPDVRTMAALSLGEIGPSARAAVPNLTAILGDEELQVREAAASALACIAPITTGKPIDRATEPATPPVPR